VGVGLISMKSKMKLIFEKIINLLLNAFIFMLVIILVASIYTNVQTKVLGNNYSNFFGYSLFEVQTGSMADTINAGDWIVVKLTKQIKLDDIITYQLGEEYITHRVTEVYSGSYVTKGDANNAKDEPIKPDQVIGKVTKILSNFGILRKTLLNPGALISLVITLFLFNYFIKKNKEEKDTKASIVNIISNKIKPVLDKLMKKKEKVEILDIPEMKKEVKIEANVEIKKEIEDETEEEIEDELSKTTVLRVIPVNLTEIDETKLEIEKNKKLEEEKGKPKLEEIPIEELKAEEDKQEPEELALDEEELMPEMIQLLKDIEEAKQTETEEGLTNIKFELLKNKKNKNIVENILISKEEELTELIDIILEGENDYIKMKSVMKSFMDTYKDARYHNYYEDLDTRNEDLKIDIVLKSLTNDLLALKKNNSKYERIVKKHLDIFKVVAKIEEIHYSVKDDRDKAEMYEKEIEKYFKQIDGEKIYRLIKIQNAYTNAIELFIKELDTNKFELYYNKIETKESMFGLDLRHKLNFSKVYSNYIIDKMYNEGIIAENKVFVLLTLISIRLIKNMMASNFKEKYILYLPSTLYKKEKKFNRFLKAIEDRFVKDSIIILMTLTEMLKNKKIIIKAKKEGYKFALVIDDKTTLNEDNRRNIYIADYIFINKKVIDTDKIMPFINEDLFNGIIYEDILYKVGDYGGEDE